MIASSETPFLQFLKSSIEKGGFTNDDVVAVVIPLLEEVNSFHENGYVAPLDNINSLLITNEKLDIDETLKKLPRVNKSKLKCILPDNTETFEISGQLRQSTTIGEYNSTETKNSQIQLDLRADLTMPVYLPHYKSFEIEIGHHDAVSDIFVLGMILASIALGLDFSDDEDLTSFVDNRESMIFLNSKIHPSIANIILGMTELDRRKRWKDLPEIMSNLKNYREYNPETEQDLALVASEKNNQKLNRRQFVQTKLRNRLFDMSRRNRLLYFKPNLKFLNLSVSSVPAVLNYKNIDPNTLFYWNSDISEKIVKGKDISLSKYIRFEDNAYIAPSLDKIRLEANKDINEYGFSQLRLVISFLNWYNTKEELTEKISSPLVLVPVNIVKKKGVKDQFILEIVDTEAEINPVLSFMLKDLYDIRLPETIQLSEMSMEEMYQNLKIQIEKTRSGIILDYLSKPKIKLIHAQAKQTLSQYKRRINKNRRINHFHNLDYSYSAENFQPLGLQLFKNYVRPEHSSLEFLINNDIKPLSANFSTPALRETSRELYHLDDGNTNPFKWEFDTCNMVVGNFNYKKMSLVRDYNNIIEENIESPVFESLFSELPKSIKEEEIPIADIKEQFNVVQSDPTQNRSVAFSRKGQNYIIQGPPGTGKSQTITNLISDYVAQGKKVLFVCEKRAAIDVVYYRLKQQGLDQLCCLIHDSQTDKKSFILNLKSTFESYTKKSLSIKEAEQARNEVISKLNAELDVIRLFHNAMQRNLDDAGVKTRELLEVLIELNREITSTDFSVSEKLTGYIQWKRHGDAIEKMSTTLNEISGSPYFSKHPLRYLNENVIQSGKSAREIKEQLERASDLLSEINERLELANLPDSIQESLSNARQFIKDAVSLLPFKQRDKMELLVPESELRKKLISSVEQLRIFENEAKEVSRKNQHWINKFSQTDVENAYEIVLKHERSFFAFLNSSFRRVKKSVNESYDFSKHKIKPPLSQVVGMLKTEYEALNKLDKERLEHELFFKLGDVNILLNRVTDLQRKISALALEYSRNPETNIKNLEDIEQIDQLIQVLDNNLKELTNGLPEGKIQDTEKILKSMMDKSADLSALSPFIKELSNAHNSLKELITKQCHTPNEVRALLAKSSLDKLFFSDREAKKLEGEHIRHHLNQIKKLYKELLRVNAVYIIANQQQRHNALIQRSELSVAGRSNAEKEEKKSITEGRKILENEFGKSMRYKSIRELATSESGQIIRELKPVWLMSPLSVSDTLPLKTTYFDVVIFDEASQITLEEGIPPVYRASQAIIVGDEMQMPPSNYFSSSSGDPDDLWDETNEEEGNLISLDADSFLTQGVRKFPSVMLGWHYRSKHESLISFSNASFYRNELLTIPDSQDNQRNLDEIAVENKDEAISNASKILERPISYHFLKHGVYENRSNTAEAEYIAQLIRRLLGEKNGLSIGVVAFSMEQQGEIESAIQRLCNEDREFEKVIEEEYKRIEDNQFVGIFFKNLENVQGDERDIIIISTCYGYDSKGKMIMNFGPINRRGGEKRLNVIFSRAKKHMCVVSSIKYSDIKNEYNEGANYFRKYLQYAEQASLGNMEMADLILKSVLTDESKKESNLPKTALIEQISLALKEKGFYTKTLIGQSSFKCHIGIKKKQEDKSYCAGIVLDDALHYESNDLLEQYLFKPELLRYSGWKTIQVFAKDWYENRVKTLNRIVMTLGEEELHGITAEIEGDFGQTELAPMEAEIEKTIESVVTADRLISQEDNSNKYWEISIDGSNLVISYGKIGTKGQRIIKTFESAEKAEIEKQRLIQQKLNKGYKRE